MGVFDVKGEPIWTPPTTLLALGVSKQKVNAQHQPQNTCKIWRPIWVTSFWAFLGCYTWTN